MKPNATLFEVFPYKYFKDSYVRLCSSFGLQHAFVQNEQAADYSRMILNALSLRECMSSLKCRTFARNADVFMTKRDIAKLVDVMKQIVVSRFS